MKSLTSGGDDSSVKRRIKYTCIETFCGAGGMGIGLKKAGFEILWAFDNNAMAVETYKNNVSKKVSVEDATKIAPEELLKLCGAEKRQITLLSGGPPCQGFSRQRRGGNKGDRRNRLIVKYIRFVQGIEPMFFLMENVDTFQNKRGKNYLNMLHKALGENYEISVYLVNCADYGVPQIRKRTIVIGVRRDLEVDYKFPKPTHTPDKWKTVGTVLRDLPKPTIEDNKEMPNHTLAQISELNIERISYVPQGSGRKCLPRRLQLPCHKKKTGWPDVYGRMSANKPAPTITGGFDNFTRGRFAHPYENRPITPREAALLQGFDKNFKFFGSLCSVRTQIGNAVPPLLSKIVGCSIINAIKTSEKKKNRQLLTKNSISCDTIADEYIDGFSII